MAAFRLYQSRLIINCITRYLSPVRLLADNNVIHDDSPLRSDEADKPFKGPIPKDKLKIKFARSSGPGGQNVNKLSTKVEVRFSVDDADWLTARVKERLNKLFKTRINKDGEMIVTSDRHRTQSQNVNDVLRKLEAFIKQADEIPRGPSELTKQRIKILKRKSEMKRLRDKKYNSSRKSDRKIDEW